MLDGKIIIPTAWKTVDLITTDDPCDFGEALRGMCFIGTIKDVGCYSTFTVNDIFKQVTSGEIFEEACEHMFNVCDDKHVYHYKLNDEECWCYGYKIGKPVEIVCGWSWDGDGCLYLRYNNRSVINYDCKKDYTWNWINK
ncbi:MAG: hypothetical protein M0R03_08825 [Novosphingobium sp.]|nr:hypothetical protein [Novosphingobium sp.]